MRGKGPSTSLHATLALIVLLILSGCAFGPVHVDPTTLMAVGTSHRCTEAELFLLVDPDRAQQALPQGFEAADAQALLQTPVPTGRGVVSILWLDCDDARSALTHARHAQLNILIQPPKADEEPVTYEFYELHRWTRDPESYAASAMAGWNVTRGLSRLEWNTTTLGRQVQALVLEDQRLAATFSFNASTGEERTLRTRYWQVLPVGLAYSESRLQSAAWRGAAACQLARDSLAARFYGGDECRPGEAFAVLLPQFQLEWRIRGFPQEGSPVQAP